MISRDTKQATKVPKYMGKQNETVAHWIVSGSEPSFSREISYFQTEWVHFAANNTDPDTVKKDLPEGFSAKDFHTINYRPHQPEEKLEEVGKVILNVQYYKWRQSIENSSLSICRLSPWRPILHERQWYFGSHTPLYGDSWNILSCRAGCCLVST